jgi:catechol 2,3-dioxygenase-like lactoylglutathione lyase family enzyme
MKFTALTPILNTGDLKGTIHFYTTVPGFTCVALDENAGWGSLTSYGMREFAIYDNNSYLLQFGQEVKNTVKAYEKSPAHN